MWLLLLLFLGKNSKTDNENAIASVATIAMKTVTNAPPDAPYIFNNPVSQFWSDIVSSGWQIMENYNEHKK